jgi:hypothetical protein
LLYPEGFEPRLFGGKLLPCLGGRDRVMAPVPVAVAVASVRGRGWGRREADARKDDHDTLGHAEPPD